MKFAAEVKNTWDHGMVGIALAHWCQANSLSAAQMIERLRDQNSARLKIINDKMAEIDRLQRPDPRGPFFSTQWEREDYERRQRGEPELGPMGCGAVVGGSGDRGSRDLSKSTTG